MASDSVPVVAGGWACSCGFRNRASNTHCGGFGKLGCKAERSTVLGAALGGGTDTEIGEEEWSQPIQLYDDAGDGFWADIRRALGRNEVESDVIKTTTNQQITMKDFANFEGEDLEKLFPIHVQIKKDVAGWTCSSCGAEHESYDHNCDRCNADRRFEGVLKSVGSDYGFIDCRETSRQFHRDVWVSRQVLAGSFKKGVATSGVHVTFVLCLNHDGQPNAKAVEVLRTEQENADDTFHGSVKYISKDKGYGFIECPKAMDLYGSDVWADLQALQGCCLGQSVSFRLRMGQIGGRPQAVNVNAEGPPPEVTPTTVGGEAAEVLQSCWEAEEEEAKEASKALAWLMPLRRRTVLLLGEGDLSFAAACAVVNPACCLEATVFLECTQWHERFSEPEDGQRIEQLQDSGHRVRFGVDATQECCSGFAAVFFNFPNVSVTEGVQASSENGLTPSGSLIKAFLERARETADPGTFIVLGLWGRCDGRSDSKLYGMDSHALIGEAITSSQSSEGHSFEDALESSFLREGVRADYTFYEAYEAAGYSFRTNWESGFAQKEWHLKACFALRVVASG